MCKMSSAFHLCEHVLGFVRDLHVGSSQAVACSFM